VFALVEHRVRIPLLDVSLFAYLRFTAASGASPCPRSRCLALAPGTAAVGGAGLRLMSAGYTWISFASADTSHLVIAGQAVVVGSAIVIGSVGLAARGATGRSRGVRLGTLTSSSPSAQPRRWIVPAALPPRRPTTQSGHARRM